MINMIEKIEITLYDGMDYNKELKLIVSEFEGRMYLNVYKKDDCEEKDCLMTLKVDKEDLDNAWEALK